MKLLTRNEEYLMLAIWSLGEAAYSLKLLDEINRMTGSGWSLGTIYAPLDRLTRHGFVVSHFPDNGARQRRIYALTREGKEALMRIHELQNAFWTDLPDLTIPSGMDG